MGILNGNIVIDNNMEIFGFEAELVILALILVLVVVLLFMVWNLSSKNEGLLADYDVRQRHAMVLDEVGRLPREYTHAAAPLKRENMSMEEEVEHGTNPHGQYNVSNAELTKKLYGGN